MEDPEHLGVAGNGCYHVASTAFWELLEIDFTT